MQMSKEWCGVAAREETKMKETTQQKHANVERNGRKQQRRNDKYKKNPGNENINRTGSETRMKRNEDKIKRGVKREWNLTECDKWNEDWTQKLKRNEPRMKNATKKRNKNEMKTEIKTEIETANEMPTERKMENAT